MKKSKEEEDEEDEEEEEKNTRTLAHDSNEGRGTRSLFSRKPAFLLLPFRLVSNIINTRKDK